MGERFQFVVVRRKGRNNIKRAASDSTEFHKVSRTANCFTH